MDRPVMLPQSARKDESPDTGYRPVATYMELRDMVFASDPAKLGCRKPDTRDLVWGMVIETGYPDAVATIIVLADGTISLYFSSGGGLVGLGDYEHIAEAGQRLLSLGDWLTPNFDQATDYSLPKRSHTRVYLMAYSGFLAAEVSLNTPWKQPGMMALADRTQELFAMIRELADQIAEQREGRQPSQPHRIN
jgi:hypothetical protein